MQLHHIAVQFIKHILGIPGLVRVIGPGLHMQDAQHIAVQLRVFGGKQAVSLGVKAVVRIRLRHGVCERRRTGGGGPQGQNFGNLDTVPRKGCVIVVLPVRGRAEDDEGFFTGAAVRMHDRQGYEAARPAGGIHRGGFAARGRAGRRGRGGSAARCG